MELHLNKLSLTLASQNEIKYMIQVENFNLKTICMQGVFLQRHTVLLAVSIAELSHGEIHRAEVFQLPFDLWLDLKNNKSWPKVCQRKSKL